MQHEWIVSKVCAGQRLGTFVRDQLEGKVSAREIKRWIESNRCEVNGSIERFASRSLNKGDRVSFREGTRVEQRKPHAALFEDADLLIYSKPAGITSEQLVKTLTPAFKRLELVHRLDKDTSGVLLLARNNRTKIACEALFRQREIKKTYWAIVSGFPKDTAGTCKSYLGPVHSYEGQTIYASVDEKQGRYAETSWCCLRRGNQASLIECRPMTGRTHQLRVHLKELGSPILGDYQYDRQQSHSYRPQRHLLHALQLVFIHPVSGKLIEVKAPLPSDFLEALTVLLLR